MHRLIHTLLRVVFALALTAGLAACSGGGSPTPPAGRSPAPARLPGTATPSPSGPAVTIDDAGRVLTDVLTTDDVARANGEERLALELSRDGQHATTPATYRSANMAPPRYTWGARNLMVPRLVGYPLWFAATVERHASTGESRLAVMVFMRANETDRWQISFSSLLDSGQEAPVVRLDESGYATALATRDESVMVSPHLMGPLHATIAEEGASGFAAGLLAPGPHTTGYFTQITADRRLAKDRDCMNYDSIFAATTYPVFALRRADGGALIMYGLTRKTTWTPVLKCGEGKRLEIPQGARWLLSDPVILNERSIQEAQQYVTVVPAKNAGTTAQVIGYDGVVIKATTR